MTLRLSLGNHLSATMITIAACLLSASAYATEQANNDSSGKVHPVAETKKAAKAVGHGVKKTTKAIGHGFRDGARAVGHGTRDVTRKVGHAFRDGVHKTEEKKD